MAIRKVRYLKKSDTDKLAIVLYTDSTTQVIDNDGRVLRTAGGDRFGEYVKAYKDDGYFDDSEPGWQVPDDPVSGSSK